MDTVRREASNKLLRFKLSLIHLAFSALLVLGGTGALTSGEVIVVEKKPENMKLLKLS